MQVRLIRPRKPSADGVSVEMIHSCQDMRVILMELSPGGEVPAATSSSSVSLQVVSGGCDLLAGCEWVPAEAGTIWFYPPGEPFGVRATDGPATVLATYAPRP